MIFRIVLEINPETGEVSMSRVEKLTDEEMLKLGSLVPASGLLNKIKDKNLWYG